MFGFSDFVNLLSSSPGKALHLQSLYKSCETVTIKELKINAKMARLLQQMHLAFDTTIGKVKCRV